MRATYYFRHAAYFAATLMALLLRDACCRDMSSHAICRADDALRRHCHDARRRHAQRVALTRDIQRHAACRCYCLMAF